MNVFSFKIRYQFYQNCNFTEIGEPFAEQPLAVAVQQGSHLQKEISRAILELQKERYFETLSGMLLGLGNLFIQDDCVGFNPGNGEKLSYSQAVPGQLLGCRLYSLHFPC